MAGSGTMGFVVSAVPAASLELLAFLIFSHPLPRSGGDENGILLIKISFNAALINNSVNTLLTDYAAR